jgi:transposase
MFMAHLQSSIYMHETDQRTLSDWISAHNTPQQVVLRSRIILLSEKRMPDTQIASTLSVSRHTCRLWRSKYIQYGPKGLWEIAPGRGKKPNTRKVNKIIKATLQTKPKGQTHWSTRTLAKAQGVSKDTVNRIWQANNIKPHLNKTFKLSRDSKFIEKLTDVVGVYLNPPDNAIVLCMDEKSQIQALDRTQPGLPLKKGRCGTMTHDYKRNGTTCLFAALNFLEGKVVGQCYSRHRHQEFLKFLRYLDREFPKEKDMHLIMDNYGTHKKDKVQEWLKKHPRFKQHFIPTSSSWLNLVERWFRELTDKSIRRGVFRSVPELNKSINEFIESWNDNPHPFVWTASVESILGKMKKAKRTLENIEPGCTRLKRKKIRINV